MNEGTVGLVGKMMCSECDAFLGKPHKDTCVRAGHLVEQSEAMEKFTTVEHAEQEDPLVGIDRDTAELILRGLRPQSEIGPDDREKMEALRTGLAKFVTGAS